MGERHVVVDTNVLLNLATPVVDGRSHAPTGEDPLKAVLTVYDVHVPSSVLGEVTDKGGCDPLPAIADPHGRSPSNSYNHPYEATASDDLLAAAAELVLKGAHHLSVHDVTDEIDDPLAYGLDRGESHGIWLANDLSAAMFVTDEFNSTNYLFIALALDDRNTLFTAPHVLCLLADRGILDNRYVAGLLTYYVETKGWDRQYVAQLRKKHLID